jgi:hypothetical protein
MPSYPRTATGDMPGYPAATGEMPGYPPATGELSSYPQAADQYPRLSASYPAMTGGRKLDKRRMMMIGGAAALGLLLIVVVAVLASGGGDDRGTAAAEPRASTVIVPRTTTDAPVVSRADPTHVAPTPSPEHANDEDVPPPSPNVVGSGPCKLTVTTTPAGSIISVDGNTAGPSPLTIANACQRTRIDVSHPRYQSQARFVALAADHPATLDVTLSRPTHAVTVMTLPPGAEVSIDGRRAGTTPTIVQVMGFTSVDLTIEKGGYKTLTKRVYSRVPQDRVFVKLDHK